MPDHPDNLVEILQVVDADLKASITDISRRSPRQDFAICLVALVAHVALLIVPFSVGLRQASRV